MYSAISSACVLIYICDACYSYTGSADKHFLKRKSVGYYMVINSLSRHCTYLWSTPISLVTTKSKYEALSKISSILFVIFQHVHALNYACFLLYIIKIWNLDLIDQNVTISLCSYILCTSNLHHTHTHTHAHTRTHTHSHTHTHTYIYIIYI